MMVSKIRGNVFWGNWVRAMALAAMGVVLGGPYAAAAETSAGAAAGAPTSAAAAKARASKDSPQLAAFKRAIRAKYDLKEKAFAEHDAETIVTRFYSSDVVSVGEGEGVFIGRDQIRPLYQEVVKEGKVKVESVSTFVSGNAGWDWADFHVYPLDAKKKPFTFAILFLWAKVDGEWICKGDFFVNGSFKAGKLQSEPAKH
jgi:ketosteroid isomerase-like protein